MEVPTRSVSASDVVSGREPQNRYEPIRIVIVNEVWDSRDVTADAALDRFSTLTGWAEALVDAGADVVVCQRFGRAATLVRRGISYQFFADGDRPRPSTWFRGSASMRSAIASLSPAVVHINGLDYPRSIRKLRRTLQPTVAIVVQDHGGFDPRTLSPARRTWLRYGLTAVNTLLVAMPDQAVEMRDSGLVPDRVHVRDVMEGSTTLTAERRLPHSGPLNVLWVGRLNANKGPLTVLDGFAEFVAAGHDARLTFVYGTAELERPLRDAIGRHAIEDRVTLAGAVQHDRLQAFYSAADVFVLGSRREGSGYAALEAMACGVVPVLTDIPSFRGLTDNGRVGALWTAGDPKSLAGALGRITSFPLDRQRDECRRRFDECFSWSAIGRRAVAIYRECSAR